jgi:hypothetical protein
VRLETATEGVNMRVRIGVLLCAVAAAALLAGCSDKTAGDEQTLTFTEGRGEFNPIGETTQNGVPPGSGFAITAPLEDDSGASAGNLYAVCVSTSEESSGEAIIGTCTGTVDLDAGQFALNVGGEIGESVTGSIVGGTGDYEGATGTFESSGDNPSTDTFTYTLP